MEMFQAGDALAFYALLERHAGMVWKIARQYFGSAAEIDDLVQDLTLTLWQNKNAWKPGAARFSSWLYRVASNKCIDMLRQKRIPAHNGVAPDDLMALSPNAEDRVVSQQQAKQMQDLLAELPLNQKLALTLYYYEDASLPQIAERLNVSELAARSLLKRGKQNLRELMSLRC
jgi:RNA polymerase sigma-70 factor (ECF subfamily)